MEVSWLCLRAGVTGPLWFYGRNMRILGAKIDQEAGTALIKCNYESAPFPCLGVWVLDISWGTWDSPFSSQNEHNCPIIASPFVVLPSPYFTAKAN